MNPFPPTLLTHEKFILIEIENKQNNYHLTRRLTFKMRLIYARKQNV